MSQMKDNTMANISIHSGNLTTANISSQSSGPATHLPFVSRNSGTVSQPGGKVYPLHLASAPFHVAPSSLLVSQSTHSNALVEGKNIQLISSQAPANKFVDQVNDHTSDRLKSVANNETCVTQDLSRKPLQIKIQGGRQLQIGGNTSAGVQVTSSGNIVQVLGTMNAPGIHMSKSIPQIALPPQVSSAASNKSSPQLIYIQKNSGVKSFPSTESVISAKFPNPTTGVQILPKPTSMKTSKPIVIQKPKVSSQNFVSVPLNEAQSTGGKHTFTTYLNAIKKPPSSSSKPQEQKVMIAPVNKVMPANVSNKVIFSSMTTKGPFVNFQIANGQIQNDPQGNITVMQDSLQTNAPVIPPLQPITSVESAQSNAMSNMIVESKPSENSYTTSIPGSRAELIGEQEYALSIPDNNSIGDDVITVSISDDNEENHGASYTINISDNEDLIDGNRVIGEHASISLLNSNAPSILRRSLSEENQQNDQRKVAFHIASDIENKIEKAKKKLFNKSYSILNRPIQEKDQAVQICSLYCEEKLDQEHEAKNTQVEVIQQTSLKSNNQVTIGPVVPQIVKDRRKSRVSSDVTQVEPVIVDKDSYDEDSLGLQWNNDTALLKGSYLQFHTNEFGIIDVLDGTNDSTSSLPKYNTPIKQRLARDGVKKPSSPEDLYCCDGCGCHGMAAEFITPNFCSHTCQRNYDHFNIKEKNMMDLKRKRKPRKSLLIKSNVRDENKQIVNEAVLSDSRVAPPLDTTDKSSKWKHENGFIWSVYLDWCKAISAPEKLFKQQNNYKHGFKPGMKIEAMDPLHQSLFAVVSVSEVQGYRLKLHFDSYHDRYDYWLNADSSDIFPPGWCEKNGKVLIPPKGYTQSTFTWAHYVKQTKAILAPRGLFPHLSSTNYSSSGFRVGMKLEAEDRKNSLTCIATIADIMENRLLIHFDSWNDIYDYWVQPNSPYIHPIGWCEKNGYSLTPPNTYKNPDNFTWDAYLKETKSVPVPARAFKPRAPYQFKVGMKLEAVDKRVPFLIRVATVSDIKVYQIRISFDGMPDELSLWADDDSPDIYPVGWCLKTGHPLEPPLTLEERSVPGVCGVNGCQGLGNILKADKTHKTFEECPYALPPRRVVLPDRLADMLPPPHHSEPRIKEPKRVQRGRPPKAKFVENDAKQDATSDEEWTSGTCKRRKRGPSPMSQETVERSVFEPGYTPNPNWNAPPTWGLPSRCMALDDILQKLSLRSDAQHWTHTDVQEFVEKLSKSREISWRFYKQQIDGESFLMLTQEDLISVLGMRLGPAIKIYNSIIQLRKKIVV